MTASLVVDASFIVTQVLLKAKGQDLIEKWITDGYTLYAPSLLAHEITSTLTKAVHFGQFTEDKARRLLLLSQQLGIQLVEPTNEQMTQAFNWTRQLQRAAAYDSFYLALAESLECDLWTADKRLANAANVDWVKSVSEDT